MKFLMTYEAINHVPASPAKEAEIAAFTQEMAKRGILLMTGGLVRPSTGARVQMLQGKYTVTDGPYPETKELIDGFALVEVKSKDEAIDVARRFMIVAGDGRGEILQVFDQPIDR